MNDRWTLLPHPREVIWREGSYRLPDASVVCVDAAVAERLNTALAELVADAAARAVALEIEPSPSLDDGLYRLSLGVAPGEPVCLGDSPEAYQLAVSPTGVSLVAREAHGLFDGLQTLRQLMAQGDGCLPCVLIRDWPALSMRGVHLDLKGGMAPAEYWQETIRLLAHFKTNAVLVEYEDKFPYQSHPDIVAEDALTREELDAILRTARDHFVEVIPLLQCLGHVEYILRHPCYDALRESGEMTQFCPLHEGSLPLFCELADEVMDAHPDARWFHLGADEAWLLGDCPLCRQHVAEHGKLDLFLGYVNRAIAHVRDRGLTPIIWDDMIQRNLDEKGLELLPEDVVLCDWFYRQRGEKMATFYYGGGDGHSRYVWASRAWLCEDPSLLAGEIHWLEDAPPTVDAFARNYWDRGEYPRYGASLPWIRFFVDNGRAVIGASAAKGADGLSAFSPRHGGRLSNLATWAQAAKEDGAIGVITTAWSRYNGVTMPCEPFEAGWHGYLASAAFNWEARDPDRRALDRQVASCFLGLREADDDEGCTGLEAFGPALDWFDDNKVASNVYALDAAIAAFESWMPGATAHGQRYLAYLALAARLERVQHLAEDWLASTGPHVARVESGTLTSHTQRRLVDGGRALLNELNAWRADAKETLPDMLGAPDVDEAIATQTTGLYSRIEHLLDIIGNAAPYKGEFK